MLCLSDSPFGGSGCNRIILIRNLRILCGAKIHLFFPNNKNIAFLLFRKNTFMTFLLFPKDTFRSFLLFLKDNFPFFRPHRALDVGFSSSESELLPYPFQSSSHMIPHIIPRLSNCFPWTSRRPPPSVRASTGHRTRVQWAVYARTLPSGRRKVQGKRLEMPALSIGNSGISIGLPAGD